MPRVAKADCPNTALVSRLQSRPRIAFHRYITSFFGGAHDRNVVADLPKARSRASSFGSRPGSSLYGSVPSLDVISPTAFMFSGPSLRSAGSHSDSLSRLPSLAETNSDVQLIRRARTDSFSMLDSSSVTEDAILEPGVDEGITRTVNDVLLGVRTPTERDESSSIVTLEDSSSVFSDTQEHVVRNRLHSVRNNPTSPVCTFAALLSPYLDTATWSALRLTNRAWYLALGVAAPPTFPSSYHLPVEILHHVYDYLSPKDFNAVRHTCQHWMRASLDKKLLTTMLRRGGWLSGAEDTNCRARSVSSHPIADTVSQSKEWLLSRHLSRQCALSSGWTGNGLDTRVAITERSEVDFSELANGYAGGLVFATSLCSRFVCVARETLIYIYDLDNGVPVPITSVICPRRVLEVSMDVSSGRHAIAALLEGRMGLVCELHYGRTIRGNDPVEVHVDVDGQEKGTASASIQTSCVNDYETGDHLYFLSPRPGFESAKKLRLISSAAHPEDRPAISRKFFGRPTMSAFWGSFGFESASNQPGSPNCDHYHAVPLSDGYHILFIDPANGLLTLGCDAPLGGPTKLLRKIIFIPPEKYMVPRLYIAAADLSQGVRIVVTYGETLVLYSVPPDVIQLSQMEQNVKSWESYTASTNLTLRHQRDHWLN
ncbi:hypothetical protein AA0116_g7943 [Alternaria tenuissima]|nr:hypothetical protein AA0116_g7943 [Alternaria tenuissima]